MGGIRLLAIAPSGETYVVEITGRTWIVYPPGAGDPRPADMSAAERAVSDHGFEWVDKVFDNPEELDAYRNEVAARVAPEVATRLELFDEDDARRLLAVARRWHAEGDPRGTRLARRLLRVPVVRTNADLASDIVDLIDIETPVNLTRPAETLVGQVARDRFLDEPAAA